ncbi:MAG: GAF domain-containing protein, partial [Pleurocapsa sp. SU_196_0]|nr:GAF domain-containing protein [Pleurocapsa sp. SU_196_0]
MYVSPLSIPRVIHKSVDNSGFTGIESLPLVASGVSWRFEHNPWFLQIVKQEEWIYVEEAVTDSRLKRFKAFATRVSEIDLHSLLMVPMFYQGRLLGVVELHHTDPLEPYRWSDSDIALVEAIATQVGIALIQAQAYAELEDLNQQLEALERARSNLIAITGHELRTPLNAILGYTELILDEIYGTVPESLREVLERGRTGETYTIGGSIEKTNLEVVSAIC